MAGVKRRSPALKTVGDGDDPAGFVGALARQHGPDAVAELLRLGTGAESESVRVAALRELLDRAYGRAPTVTGSETRTIAYVLIDDGY